MLPRTLYSSSHYFPISFLFTFFRTLLQVFALAQITTFLFSSDSALFTKNTRGGVSCPSRWGGFNA
jgi:hypothetical protein